MPLSKWTLGLGLQKAKAHKIQCAFRFRELGKEDVISLLDQALGATALCNSYLGRYSHHWLPPQAHVHVGEPRECVVCVYLLRSKAPTNLINVSTSPR